MAAFARRGCHYSEQQFGRMCSTAENPSVARIASCQCSWLGLPRYRRGEPSGGQIRPSNELPKFMMQPALSENLGSANRTVVIRDLDPSPRGRGMQFCSPKEF